MRLFMKIELNDSLTRLGIALTFEFEEIGFVAM